MQDNKQYTAADFRAYHNGTMPAGQMHALEKAALDDPFLADALEGYAITPDIDFDMSDLNERLQKKTDDGTKPKVAPLKSLWFKIAAAVLVIITVTYFIVGNDNQEKNTTLAQESSAPANDPAINNISIDTNKLSNLGADNVKVLTENKVQSFTTTKKFDKKTDLNAKPIQSVQDQKISAKDDYANGRLNLQQDSLTNIISGLEVTSVSKNNQQTETARAAPQILQIEPAKKSTAALPNNKEVLDKAKAVNEIEADDNSIEVINSAELDNYINKNKTPVTNKNGAVEKGEVILSFIKQEKSKVESVQIISSTCAACNPQAIKLTEGIPKKLQFEQGRQYILIKF